MILKIFHIRTSYYINIINILFLLYKILQYTVLKSAYNVNMSSEKTLFRRSLHLYTMLSV